MIIILKQLSNLIVKISPGYFRVNIIMDTTSNTPLDMPGDNWHYELRHKPLTKCTQFQRKRVLPKCLPKYCLQLAKPLIV